MIVGRFYHYSCHHGANGGSEVSTCSSDETVNVITVIISVFIAVESSIHTSFVSRAIKIIVLGRYRINSVSPCTSGND